MPCRVDQFDEQYSDYRNLLREADKVTAFLCAVLRTLTQEEKNRMYQDVPGLLRWWTHHQEVDRAREDHERQARERERARKEAEYKRLGRELGYED